MQIQLLQDYQGTATREHRYFAGTYDTADLEPALVTYWLHSGFAVTKDALVKVEQPPKTKSKKEADSE